jgi:hypothetical protein
MSDPEFAFEKKLGIPECAFGNNYNILRAFEKLLIYMEETNKKQGVECEFFRLDSRQPNFDEISKFPIRSIILDMKLGSKKEEILKRNRIEDYERVDKS